MERNCVTALITASEGWGTRRWRTRKVSVKSVTSVNFDLTLFVVVHVTQQFIPGIAMKVVKPKWLPRPRKLDRSVSDIHRRDS